MRQLSWICLFMLSGCVFDPDPGPDSSKTDEETANEGGNEHDAGVPAAGANATTDIYVSAPDPDGQVTVVGILPAGSPMWNTGQVVVGLDGQGENLVVKVGDDGSFAFRVDANALSSLQIAPTQDAFGTLDGNRVDIPINRTGAEPVGNRILGESGSVAATDAGQIRIIGRGDLLQAGARVVGGNLTLSSGAQADVICSPDCRFDMAIAGESGDEIALFLYFPYGTQAADGTTFSAGSTDTQTVTVP